MCTATSPTTMESATGISCPSTSMVGFAGRRIPREHPDAQEHVGVVPVSCLRGLRCVYYAVMIHFFSTYAIRPAGLLLVSVFAASLLWCGDAACWSGASDGQCASLICSLLTRHNTSNESHNGDCSAACMCVCHTPTILEIDVDIEHHLPAHNTAFEFTASTPYSPARSIYRPPKS